MNRNAICRRELDAVFSALEREFRKVSREIDTYDKDLEDHISQMALSTRQGAAPGVLREDHPLLALFAAMRMQIGQDCETWLANLEINHRNRVFRDKFNESMLVYVYGKVKSSKSSLGNFLAYGKHDPTPEEVAAQPGIEFDVEQVSDACAEDSAKLEKQRAATRKDRKFLVDFLEATACIQYFKKPGFTWVDSPGIHSTTEKNGKLATDYLECADLVVYTMSSRSPARESDREEIRRIIKSGRKLLLLVTRCDDTEKDVDEETDELVLVRKMLSPAEREEIRQVSIDAIMEDLGPSASPHIREELEKNTVTLSVQYAEEHPEEPGWSESGVPAFYAVLGNIARSEGVRLKMRAPFHAMLDHVGEMQQNVTVLKSQLAALEAQFAKVRSTLEQQEHKLAVDLGRQLEHDIMSMALEYAGDDSRFRQRVSDAAERALEQASRRLAETVAKDTLELTNRLRGESVKLDDVPTYEDICQTITYRTTGKKRVGMVLGLLLGAGAAAVLAGPLGWGLAAAEIGAAISTGTLVGSKIGSSLGNALDGSESTQVKVGDNSLDVGRSAAALSREWLERALDGIYNGIAENCLSPLQEQLRGMQLALEEFEKFLAAKKTSLEQEVEA